jgi:hypothetical protein
VSAVSDPAEVMAAVDRFDAAQAELAALSFHALSGEQALAVKDRLETVARRQGAIDHRLTSQMVSQTSPAQLGGTSWPDVLSNRLRIGRGQARRHIDEAADVGPRTALTGEPLPPALPNVAAAQSAGSIGAEHVRIIRRFFHDLPTAVDYQTREQCEATLARIAAEHTPDALRKAAERLMALVHPDGDFCDVDRARRRGVVIGNQQADGMSKISGLLDPEARATIDAVLSKWAAPGMCNPDDASPCVDGTPSQEQIQNDQRSTAQRNHDALKAMGRSVLSSGELGHHHGLPVTIVVSTTLQELNAGAGQAVTATGTLLPMPTVIKMASHAYHYLSIFDRHTGRALYLGRTRRIASADQRIVSWPGIGAVPAPAAWSPGPTARYTTRSTTGPTTAKPTSMTSPWAAEKTTAPSNPAAGPPANAKTAAPNGSHHRTSRAANHGSTTTTTPKTCYSPTTKATSGLFSTPHRRRRSLP